MRSHLADSRLIFEVAEEPKPGQMRVLLDFGGNTELLHLAESITAAERSEEHTSELQSPC